ncbi:MAG TPA: hypothetical protein VFG23_08485 [Polyangia bacterium]|nr:hypothetical protein [Polyangia bacterium]
MESTKKRVGRPKSEARTGPLVLDEPESRQKTEIELTTPTASQFAEYAAWVEMSSSLNTVDAKSKTVEFALRDLFRRDRLWRERQATVARAASIAPVAATPHPVPASPSLPPAPAARPVPTVAGALVNR